MNYTIRLMVLYLKESMLSKKQRPELDEAYRREVKWMDLLPVCAFFLSPSERSLRLRTVSHRFCFTYKYSA